MSQFNTISYDIERNTGLCAFTGEALAPGDSYVATLVDLNAADAAGEGDAVPDITSADDVVAADEAKTPMHAASDAQAATSPPVSDRKRSELGFKRVDVSIKAWEQGHRPPHLFSFWKSVVAEPNAKRKMFVDDEVLVDMFRRLGDAGQQDREAFRFVLGLILMRKKKLRYEGVTVEPDEQGVDQEYWLMMPIPKGDIEQPWRMLNPHLEEDEIQKVADELNEIMNGEVSEG